MAYSPVLTVPPPETPVSLTEVKSHCRIDSSGEDTILAIYLDAAVSHFDGWDGILGRALVSQTWRQDFGGFSCLRLLVQPVASIASITYYDSDNAQQTLSSDVYVLRSDALGSYVDLKAGEAWPSAYARGDAVSVSYVAGSAAADVPGALKAAILLTVAHLYEHRMAVDANDMAVLPMAVDALTAPYRRINV